MTPEKIRAAVNDAKRFLAAVKKLEEAEKQGFGYSTPRESGAVKRASMDLTRALADMRRRG